MAKALQTRVSDLEQLYHSDKVIGLRIEEETDIFVPSTNETLSPAEFEQRYGERGVILHIVFEDIAYPLPDGTTIHDDDG